MPWEGEVIYGAILIFDSHLNISKAWMKYVQVTIKSCGLSTTSTFSKLASKFLVKNVQKPKHQVSLSGLRFFHCIYLHIYQENTATL